MSQADKYRTEIERKWYGEPAQNPTLLAEPGPIEATRDWTTGAVEMRFSDGSRVRLDGPAWFDRKGQR